MYLNKKLNGNYRLELKDKITYDIIDCNQNLQKEAQTA